MKRESAARFRTCLRGMAGIAFAFWLGATLLFAGSPQLHERLHRDASNPAHHCVVTLLGVGLCDLSEAAPLVRKPRLTAQVARLPSLTPVWVKAPFLSAAIFEHAPPALS